MGYLPKVRFVSNHTRLHPDCKAGQYLFTAVARFQPLARLPGKTVCFVGKISGLADAQRHKMCYTLFEEKEVLTK